MGIFSVPNTNENNRRHLQMSRSYSIMKKYIFPKAEEAKKAEELEKIKLAEEEMIKKQLKEEKERRKFMRSPLSWNIKEAGNFIVRYIY
mgnify:CR=1 FL=1